MCPEVGPEGWLRCSAHPFVVLGEGGIHSTLPAFAPNTRHLVFAPGSSEVAVGFFFVGFFFFFGLFVYFGPELAATVHTCTYF